MPTPEALAIRVAADGGQSPHTPFPVTADARGARPLQQEVLTADGRPRRRTADTRGTLEGFRIKVHVQEPSKRYRGARALSRV